MVLNLLDESVQPLRVLGDAGVRYQIIDEVIEAVNREFDCAALRATAQADQEKVRSRIHLLVGKAYRSRGVVPGAAGAG